MHQMDKEEIFVRAYVRSEFESKCMVTEIIRLIRFYTEEHGSLYIYDGNKKYVKQYEVPTKAAFFSQQNCLDVATFYNHSLMIDSFGCVHSIESFENIITPKKISIPQKAISVALGREHSIVLTDDGLIFSFGESDCGQTGRE